MTKPAEELSVETAIANCNRLNMKYANFGIYPALRKEMEKANMSNKPTAELIAELRHKAKWAVTPTQEAEYNAWADRLAEQEAIVAAVAIEENVLYVRRNDEYLCCAICDEEIYDTAPTPRQVGKHLDTCPHIKAKALQPTTEAITEPTNKRVGKMGILGVYIGRVIRLQGEGSLLRQHPSESDCWLAQFNKLDLGHWALGWHEFPKSDFRIEEGQDDE